MSDCASGAERQGHMGDECTVTELECLRPDPNHDLPASDLR